MLSFIYSNRRSHILKIPFAIIIPILCIVVCMDGSMWYTPNHYGEILENPNAPPSKSNKPLGHTWRRIK